MKVLYAIQGTGNGHLARAIEIVPQLAAFGSVDVLLSGTQGDLKLPFDVKYQFRGLSFYLNKGGVSFLKTIVKFNLYAFVKDVWSLSVHEYDLVISDFEPVSAWACLLKGKECVGLSHQNAVLHHSAPRPLKRQFWGEQILKYYAPTSVKYGFHFRSLDHNNFTPVIREAVRASRVCNLGHYTVYLPAFSDKEILNMLSRFPKIKWQVFSKKCKTAYCFDHIKVNPVSITGFSSSFSSCEGILTTGGFETPAEALYMGKKLFIVPMKNQYEQACNAAFLQEMGICVVDDFLKSKSELQDWLENGKVVKVRYSNNTLNVIEKVLTDRNEKYYASSRYKLFSEIFQLKLIPIKGLCTFSRSSNFVFQEKLKEILNQVFH